MEKILTIIGYGIAAWLLIFWPLFIVNKIRNARKARKHVV